MFCRPSGDSRKKNKKEKKIEGGEKEARRKEHEVNPCECIHPRALHTWPSKDFHTYSVEENTRLRMYARGNKPVKESTVNERNGS